MTESSQTLVFGFDGACFELIRPWLDAGALPMHLPLLDIPLNDRFDCNALPLLDGAHEQGTRVYDRFETVAYTTMGNTEADVLDDRLKSIGYLA